MSDARKQPAFSELRALGRSRSYSTGWYRIDTGPMIETIREMPLPKMQAQAGEWQSALAISD
jgi:hypothetical protein